VSARERLLWGAQQHNQLRERCDLAVDGDLHSAAMAAATAATPR